MSDNQNQQTTLQEQPINQESPENSVSSETAEAPKKSFINSYLLAQSKMRKIFWYILAVIATILALYLGQFFAAIMFIVAIVFTLPSIESRFENKPWLPWVIRVVCAVIGAAIMSAM